MMGFLTKVLLEDFCMRTTMLYSMMVAPVSRYGNPARDHEVMGKGGGSEQYLFSAFCGQQALAQSPIVAAVAAAAARSAGSGKFEPSCSASAGSCSPTSAS